MKIPIICRAKGSSKDIQEFKSVTAAVKVLGIPCYFITDVLKGRKPDIGGYVFEYKNIDDSLLVQSPKEYRRQYMKKKRQQEKLITIQIQPPNYEVEEKKMRLRVEKYKKELIDIQKDEREVQIRNKIEGDLDPYYST